ncbi:MAG: hypothetical protein J6J71_01360 [Prevotella sp.]|nr:hypothetical protein [Prevotella sp.]
MDKDKKCFLCGRNGRGDRLERHHIFSGARRPLSEKYGLVVYLCGNRCHRLGEYSAHQNAEVAHYLHRYGQQKAMQEQGWSTAKFIEIFGKNYLDQEE